MKNAISTDQVDVSKGNILYFEDDEELAKLTGIVLLNQGYRVFHFNKYPLEGVEKIQAVMGCVPDIALIDICMPKVDGYQICQELLAVYGTGALSVIFTSGKSADDQVMRAYEVGADDYMPKPFRPDELRVKIDKIMLAALSVGKMDDQLDGARTTAFEAMAENSELGVILRFLESSYLVKSFDELSTLLLSAVDEFNVSSSVMFFIAEREFYYSSDSHEHPIEKRVLQAANNRGRIFDVGSKTLFNFPSVSLLIKNMPIDDELRYGRLKDQMCLLLSGVSERLKGLELESVNLIQKDHMQIVGSVIGKMVMDMEKNSVKLSEEFEKVILDLEANLSAEFLRFNLLEDEEEALIEHVKNTVASASLLFERSVNFETQYSSVMQELLLDLNK